MAPLVDVVGKQTRHEIPFARVTWREGAVTRIVEVGAHCLDESWPWWRPHAPWEPLERGSMAKKKTVNKSRPKRAQFVDPRGTLEKRVDDLSDRVRALERQAGDVNTGTGPAVEEASSETRHTE